MISPAQYAPARNCCVYTPDSLANAIVGALAGPADATWLEPSVGAGVFLRALSAHGVGRERITAIDLSRQPQVTDGLAQTTRGIDFLRWAQQTDAKFGRVIGNPPYVPLDELSIRARKVALSVKMPSSGKPIRGTGNLWAAFVAAAVEKVDKGGALSLVLPAAWDYANYAAELRDWMPKKFGDFGVIRCRQPLFETVEEGAIVILAQHFDESPGSSWRVECDSLEETIVAIRNHCSKRSSARPVESENPIQVRRNSVRLDSVATIRIGGVTGDSDYFLLTESQRTELGLPTASCKHVLTHSEQLTTPFVTAEDWIAMRDEGARIWLFYPNERMAGECAAVKEYLALPHEHGGCNRSSGKVSNRTPWYRTPLPDWPHAFISGMSEAGPWLCYNRMPGLNASNTLYTVRFACGLSASERIAIGLGMLTSDARRQLHSRRRVYPAGLNKWEPKDLAGVVIPRRHSDASQSKIEDAYRMAVLALLRGDHLQSARLADDYFAD